MPQRPTTLRIGTVTLGATATSLAERDFEVPSEIAGLGAEMLASVHEYPGGTRMVQTHGAQPQPIHWTAKLVGPEAISRMLTLKRLVTAESLVQFSWGPFLYDVVVKEFSPTVRHEYLVDYSIALEPVRDRSEPMVNAVVGDLSSAQVTKIIQALKVSLTNTPLPSSIVGVAPTVASPPASGTGIVGTIASVQADLDSASGTVANLSPTQVSNDRASLQTQITALVPYLVNADKGIESAARVITAHLTILRGLLANPGTLFQVVKATNPNLHALAAQYYGDATQWTRIAQANGLTDPFPSGFQIIVVPK